jgi:RNA polymerase sigma-70 factor (ECF subfamily)
VNLQDRPHERAGLQAAEFASTRWSVVLAAGDLSTPAAKEALTQLCQDYWYPLYVYVRRRTGDLHESQDLIQEFFTRLLERNVLAAADPQRGRFRAFLLTSLRNFLANEWAKARAEKRKPGSAARPLDFESGERRYRREPADHLTPERLYEQHWAETLLDRVIDRLRDEYVRSGKTAHFEQLRGFLTGKNPDVSYREASGALGISEGAAMVMAHRMRRRFRDLLRGEIAQTVSDPGSIDDEIAHLFAALAR